MKDRIRSSKGQKEGQDMIKQQTESNRTSVRLTNGTKTLNGTYGPNGLNFQLGLTNSDIDLIIMKFPSPRKQGWELAHSLIAHLLISLKSNERL